VLSSSTPKVERSRSVLSAHQPGLPHVLGSVGNRDSGCWRNLLGQAAPILYGLPADAITDVIAHTAATNANGTTYATASTPVSYTPAEWWLR